MAETRPGPASGEAMPRSLEAGRSGRGGGWQLRGYVEYFRRAVVLILTVMALMSIADAGLLTAAAWAVAALMAYVFIPRAPRPAGAKTYSQFAAVIGPDLVGLLLTGIFIVLPFWARASDAPLWQDFGILVHPAALLTWPLALISAAILVMSARSASFWIVVDDASVHIGSIGAQHHLRFAEIERVEPFRRGLPRWFRWLVPLLAVTGRFTAAGAIMLARDSVGISLVTKDGQRIDVSTDAMEGPTRQLLNQLRKSNVPVNGVGSRPGRQRARRANPDRPG